MEPVDISSMTAEPTFDAVASPGLLARSGVPVPTLTCCAVCPLGLHGTRWMFSIAVSVALLSARFHIFIFTAPHLPLSPDTGTIYKMLLFQHPPLSAMRCSFIQQEFPGWSWRWGIIQIYRRCNTAKVAISRSLVRKMLVPIGKLTAETTPFDGGDKPLFDVIGGRMS